MNERSMPSRCFNQVIVDDNGRTITKRSQDEEKLRNEIMWYLRLPRALHSYLPDIISYSLSKGNVYVRLERVMLPSVHDLYMEAQHSLTMIDHIFNRLTEVLDAFACYRYPAPFPTRFIQEMYVDKTVQRLQTWLTQSRWAAANYERGEWRLNGDAVPCPLRLLEKEGSYLMDKLKRPFARIIHGDFCFSNLLMGREPQEMKLIDPRGSFGAAGIYGDVRYDLAKVRHSVGGYEHIMTDRFHVQQTCASLHAQLHQQPRHQSWIVAWDERCGFLAPEVRGLEALLFLSMIPLHRDTPERQLMMYGLGTRKLLLALDEL
ncbi:hypothetical protein [Marinicrinis sediminis]|uniref:Aminoglycoside phosphotransferase domain-containing protein n=1 Tax=Marinicrinis sediminis TaxID=1652465 RepID=A0ABW5RE39_9BACL